MDTHSTYTDHPVIWQIQEAGVLATAELAGRTSYTYRWASGAQHVCDYGEADSEEKLRENIESWTHQSDNIRSDGLLVPTDLALRW
jgi:hypothetical protein